MKLRGGTDKNILMELEPRGCDAVIDTEPPGTDAILECMCLTNIVYHNRIFYVKVNWYSLFVLPVSSSL